MNDAYNYYLNLSQELLVLKNEISNVVSNPNENAYLQQAISNLYALCLDQIKEIVAYENRYDKL